MVLANLGLLGVNPQVIWLLRKRGISVIGSLALRVHGQSAKTVAGEGFLEHYGRKF